jgi:adenosine deaminase
MRHWIWCCALLAAGLVAALPARGDERSTARRFEEARRDEPSLIAFLRAMPKGGDLHNHAGGAIYPEDGLRVAIRDGLYFNPATTRFETEKTAKNVPASQLLYDDSLRQQLFNAAGIRGGFGSSGNGPASGHDRFFGSFGANLSGWQKAGDAELLATLVRRARLQNLQYLELMAGPGGDAMGPVVQAVTPMGPLPETLARMRPAIEAYVKASRAELDQWDRQVAEQAGVPAPVSGTTGPVTVRYLVTAFRGGSDEQIFGTWAAAFALMKADPRVVGVNFAAPEDDPLPRERFDRHMQLLDFLWRAYEHPNVTLHAGELNLAVSPLDDMTSHIRKSIEIGHARRIGHGTAVAWEDDCPGLLRKMRDEGIAVEVCPTSEAVILGAEGDRHPFRLYQRAGVPITLNTDDEGVLRSTMTMEYVRAVRSWNLSYAEVKALVRNGIEYSFLPGESLFEGHDYRRVRPRYRAQRDSGWAAQADGEPASVKARVQARLERAFTEFER